jgi:hypothetical protein
MRYKVSGAGETSGLLLRHSVGSAVSRDRIWDATILNDFCSAGLTHPKHQRADVHRPDSQHPTPKPPRSGDISICRDGRWRSKKMVGAAAEFSRSRPSARRRRGSRRSRARRPRRRLPRVETLHLAPTSAARLAMEPTQGRPTRTRRSRRWLCARVPASRPCPRQRPPMQQRERTRMGGQPPSTRQA